MVSSVSFLAFPAAAFALDWRQFLNNATMPIGAIIAIAVFIPIFRAKMRVTAYQYIEDRFGWVVRLYGVISYLLLQVVRVGSVMYLMAIPINVLTGIPILLIILVFSIFIGIYTVIGGIEAVLWADAIQALILLGAGILSLVLIILAVPGGLPEIFRVASNEGKFGLGSFDFNFSERTFWTMMILGTFNWIAAFTVDQAMIQRYLSAGSLREARKATIIYSVVGMPTWALFFFIGTCLFVFFQFSADNLVAQMQPDQVFPYFIATHIPVGLKGLILAGIIAAAVSSLDAAINASATVATTDLLKDLLHRNKQRTDQYYLRAARLYTAFMVVCMIAGAIVFHHLPKETMFDVILIIASVFGGCLPGIFLLGFFSAQVDKFSCLVGLSVAIPFNIYLLFNTMGILPDSLTIGLHPYWVMFVVNVVFMVIATTCGYIRSFAGLNDKSKTINYTIWGDREWK